MPAVEWSDEFELWWNALPQAEQDSVLAYCLALEDWGPLCLVNAGLCRCAGFDDEKETLEPEWKQTLDCAELQLEVHFTGIRDVVMTEGRVGRCGDAVGSLLKRGALAYAKLQTMRLASARSKDNVD
jgi:hypothetical protein